MFIAPLPISRRSIHASIHRSLIDSLITSDAELQQWSYQLPIAQRVCINCDVFTLIGIGAGRAFLFYEEFFSGRFSI
jgi:hypothetical protein